MNFRWARISHYDFFLFTLNLTFLQTDDFNTNQGNYPVYGILTYHDDFNYLNWDLITMELSSKDFGAVDIFFFQNVHYFKSVWKFFSSLVIIRSIDQAFEINRSPLKIFMPIVQNSMSEALNFAYIPRR